jgi:hypothetical protein
MRTKKFDDDTLRDVARGNIERNASWEEDASPDTVHDEVYTLGFDALHDYGAPIDDCRRIARELAMGYAAP